MLFSWRKVDDRVNDRPSISSFLDSLLENCFELIKQFSTFIFLAYRKKYWSNSFKFLILPVIDKLRRRIELICASFCTRIQFDDEKLERKSGSPWIFHSPHRYRVKALCRRCSMKLHLLTRKRRPTPSLIERGDEGSFFFSSSRKQRRSIIQILESPQAARAEGKRPLPGRVVYQRGRIMHLTHDPACPLVRIISPLWTIDRR